MTADLRLALRTLRRQPGFVAVAVLSLGIALGLVTTTFAMLDAIVNPYVAYRDPEQLFSLAMSGSGRGGQLDRASLFAEVRPHLGNAEIAVYQWQMVPVQVGRSLEQRRAAAVSANFLTVMGVKPFLGRDFRPSGDEGAMISYNIWRQTFKSGGSLAGMSVDINGRSHPVTGVLPDGMDFPYVDVWTLLPASTTTTASSEWFTPVLRVASLEARQQLERSLPPLVERLDRRFGANRSGPFFLRLNPVRPDPQPVRAFHIAMGAAALAVLLIACSNLASLMLARGLARRRELALRLALGARRSRIVRLILMEAVLVAVAGAALGIVFSIWGAEAVRNQIPPHIGWMGVLEPRPNWRVFAGGLLATVTSVILFGLLPALRLSQVGLTEPLKDGSGSTTGRRRRYSALVIAEVSLSLVLLLGTGLLLKAATRVAAFDFGFTADRLVRGYVNLNRFGGRGGDTLSNAEAARRFHEIERLAEQIPGVRTATTMSLQRTAGGVVVSDRTDGGRDRVTRINYHAVSPSFGRTLGLRIVAGRDFIEGDEAVGAAVIDERAARQLWPNANGLGRLIKLGQEASDAPWVRVVGIARPVAMNFQSDPDMPLEFAVFVVSNAPARARELLVRTDSREAIVNLEIRRLLQRTVGPTFGGVQDWGARHEQIVSAQQFVAGLFGLFGVFALSLTAVGLYGVLSYAVSQRRREFGVRLALGAHTTDLVKLVLHDGLVMILAGTALGAGIAMWGSHLLREWLYSVAPTDAAALVSAELTLILVALAACIAPAIQATRANPLEVMRAV